MVTSSIATPHTAFSQPKYLIHMQRAPRQQILDTTIKERFVQTLNHEIRYLTSGSGKPLLLLHTMRTQSDYFRKIIPHLSKYYNVYVPDLPGHGGSSVPTNVAYTEEFFRTATRDFITALNLKKITIAGESFGATVALTLAATDTSHVIENVVIFNPYDYGEKGGIRRSSPTAKRVFSAVQLPLIGWMVSHLESNSILKKILQGGLNDDKGLTDELLQKLGQTRKRSGFAYAFRSMARNWKSWIAARQWYSQIKVPVTLVYSENDWSTEEEREANKNLIPNCKFKLIEGTGHFSCIDNPAAVLKIILLEECKSHLETE